MVRILFVHPDLGIGGAERLVVDAALAFKKRGHEVGFLTNHHDSLHCFQETKDGSFAVQVVGDWLPIRLFGRFYALCAYIRMLYAALYAATWGVQSLNGPVDVIFCDQIPVAIPILRLLRPRPKIVFYCHFPDQLLSKKGSQLKRMYRAPINYLEEVTMGMADNVLVNSKFTLRTFQDTFRRLRVTPDVLYPSINTNYFDTMLDKFQNIPQDDDKSNIPISENLISPDTFLYLSINRYERKKNHLLGLRAFARLAQYLPQDGWRRCRLIIAGGYDKRVSENVEHFEELQDEIERLALKQQVKLLRSPTDEIKCWLLWKTKCLLYTPIDEHFGIVPLEGMYMRVPVIACNSGGPTETILQELTGFLCEPDPDAFAQAMTALYWDEDLRERMGCMGRKRILQKFSFGAFTDALNNLIQSVLECSSSSTPKLRKQQ